MNKQTDTFKRLRAVMKDINGDNRQIIKTIHDRINHLMDIGNVLQLSGLCLKTVIFAQFSLQKNSLVWKNQVKNFSKYLQNRDMVSVIFESPTKWLSASHSTGFFCAVKVPDTKGFAKLWFSFRPFQPGKNASKTSLILRFSLKQRDMSFREWVFITHWTTPNSKILFQGWFLIVIAPRKSFFRESNPVCATFV